MNIINVFFACICVLCIVVLFVNFSVCLKRLRNIQKGLAEEKPFLTETNKKILVIFVIILYLSIIAFCAFLNVDLMEKARVFGLLVVFLPVQPLGIVMVWGYSLLFYSNRLYSTAQEKNNIQE